MTSITITILPRGPDTFGLGNSTLTILDNVRIKALKDDIQDTMGVPTPKQLLWLGNNKLADDTVQLRIAGIRNGSIIYLQDNDYIRIFFYRPSAPAREETYAKGTQTLSALMASLRMPNTQYSVTLNGNLLQGAATYNRDLNSLNIVEDSELRFNVDSTNG